MPYLSLQTPNFSHNNISFSPFFEDTLALASGTNFSLIGNGRIHIVKMSGEAPGGVGIERFWDTQEGAFDVAWNERHENQVAAALGNGAVKLFDMTLKGLPIQAWHEHSAEVSSIEWNNLDKTLFCTCSWDQSIKIWTPDRTTSVLTIPTLGGQLHSCQWSPNSPSVLALASSQGFIRLYDTRHPLSSSSLLEIRPQRGEVLSCDFNKYTPNLLAFATKDGSICTADLRNVMQDEQGMRGIGMIGKGKLGARKVRWDPHLANRLVSGGYDMSVRVWQNDPQPSRQIYAHDAHTEFVLGVEWGLFDPGLIASAGWDGALHLYRL
nr:hypothetical protein L204_00493 [Cryptococcus depauperatus CBS 7855]